MKKEKSNKLDWVQGRERHFKRCKDEFYKTEVVVTIYSKIEPSDNYLPGKEFIDIVKGLYPIKHPERKVDAFVFMTPMPPDVIDCRTLCAELEDHTRATSLEDEMELVNCMVEEGLI